MSLMPVAFSLNKNLRPCRYLAKRLYNACDRGRRDSNTKPCYYISREAPPKCAKGDKLAQAPRKSVCNEAEEARFDWLFYRPSDKARRTYQKTWADCVEPYKPRRQCKPEEPQHEKRVLSKAKREVLAKKSACALNPKNFKNVVEKKVCPSIMTDCSHGRKPPSCVPTRLIKPCKKYCCPYPSFSECRIVEICAEPWRSAECYCSELPPICNLNRIAKMMERQVK